MSYLNRVFTTRFMKTLLIVCCAALLIAAIWFLGPFFGFGESRPLQSIESRIIFILLAAFCLVCVYCADRDAVRGCLGLWPLPVGG